MAHKPPRVCREAGCSRLTTKGRCAAHAISYRTRQDKGRPNAYQRGYDKRWARLSIYYRECNPWCEVCGKALSECTDHIIPKEQGGTDDEDNLQALCWVCHSRKTAKEDGGFGR